MPFRPSHVVAAVIFLSIISWLSLSFHSSSANPNKVSAVDYNSAPPVLDDFTSILDRKQLEKLGIANVSEPSISISRLHIIANTSPDPAYAPPLSQPLDISFSSLPSHNIDETFGVDALPPAPTINVQIPSKPDKSQVDLSSIVFGVATSIERLEDSLPTLAHWSAYTNTSIIALLEPMLDESRIPHVESLAASLYIPLKILISAEAFTDCYFSLLPTLSKHFPPTKSGKKWYTFIDDDTFFLSLPTLLSVLSTHYPSPEVEPYYIGALTEDYYQMSMWGFMAYGGGGIILSAALVTQLTPFYHECYKIPQTGDKMVASCIYKHTPTKLSWEHGLHQMDLHGRHDGFYEALRSQPLSLHHWKSDGFQNHVPMAAVAGVAAVCGDDCLLRKFRFGDGWVLTNGFSVVKYGARDTAHRDLATDVSMERTWEFFGPTTEAHFEHTLAPLRKPDPDKISYRLETILTDGGASVRQIYVRRNQESHVQAIVEVTWSKG